MTHPNLCGVSPDCCAFFFEKRLSFFPYCEPVGRHAPDVGIASDEGNGEARANAANVERGMGELDRPGQGLESFDRDGLPVERDGLSREELRCYF